MRGGSLVDDLFYFIGHLDVGKVRETLEKGVDVNEKILDGNTALHSISSLASYTDDKASIEMMELVINKGADVNAKNKFRWTPLMTLISRKRNIALIKFLIERGADVNASDKKGNSVLSLALEGNLNIEVIQFLLEKGANPSVKVTEMLKAPTLTPQLQLVKTYLMDKRGLSVGKIMTGTPQEYTQKDGTKVTNKQLPGDAAGIIGSFLAANPKTVAAKVANAYGGTRRRRSKNKLTKKRR